MKGMPPKDPKISDLCQNFLLQARRAVRNPDFCIVYETTTGGPHLMWWPSDSAGWKCMAAWVMDDLYIVADAWQVRREIPPHRYEELVKISRALQREASSLKIDWRALTSTNTAKLAELALQKTLKGL